MKHRFRRWIFGFLPACCLFCAATDADAQIIKSDVTEMPTGVWQMGLQVADVRPRNAFGMDFKSTFSYELYMQERNDDGAGPVSGRVGLFYMDLKPRLDTIPTYLVQEGNSTLVIPGYLVYHKLNFKGLFIEYAYTLVHIKRLRLDVGGGLFVGIYHEEYNEGYPTVIISSASIDNEFAAFRFRTNMAWQLNKYIEVYAEYKDAIVTKTDWSAQFSHNSCGLGLNFTFKPEAND